METKHTKEYAEKLAKQKYPDKTTAGWLDHWSRSSQKDFSDGYMTAIKHAAAPDLLEFIMRMVSESNFIDESEKNEAIELIKKATS